MSDSIQKVVEEMRDAGSKSIPPQEAWSTCAKRWADRLEALAQQPQQGYVPSAEQHARVLLQGLDDHWITFIEHEPAIAWLRSIAAAPGAPAQATAQDQEKDSSSIRASGAQAGEPAVSASVDLLPCPFCGQPAKLIMDVELDFYVSFIRACPHRAITRTGASVGVAKGQAVAEWNRRAALSVTPAAATAADAGATRDATPVERLFADSAKRREASAGAAAQPADVEALYWELIYAVGNKYPGESRHQTALRYIQRAEKHDGTTGQADAAITAESGRGEA